MFQGLSNYFRGYSGIITGRTVMMPQSHGGCKNKARGVILTVRSHIVRHNTTVLPQCWSNPNPNRDKMIQEFI